MGDVVGGWQFSGDFQFHSGFPWTPVASNTCPVIGTNGLCPIRPIGYSGGASTSQSTDSFLAPATSNFPNGATSYFALATSTQPNVIPLPGIGRNSFRGPRFSQFDLSLAKQFGLPTMPFFGEGTKIQLRMDAINAFNKLNLQPFVFGSSSTTVSFGNNSGVPVRNPQFGVARSTSETEIEPRRVDTGVPCGSKISAVSTGMKWNQKPCSLCRAVPNREAGQAKTSRGDARHGMRIICQSQKRDP